MVKKATTLVVSAFVVAQCLLVTALKVDVAFANPIAVPSVPGMEISYPLSSFDGYVNSTVDFEVYVYVFIESPAPNNVSYSLDGAPLVALEGLEVTSYYDSSPDKIDFKAYKVNINLRDLSEGNHKLVAYANGMSASRRFIVNSHYQVAVLQVLSPLGVGYIEKVPVIFSVNGEIVNAHYYLYRGRESVVDESLSGNTTLSSLPIGSYEMYLFVTTEYGQSSARIPFSIVDSAAAKTLPIILGVIALILFSVAVGLLVYLKNHKRL